jgi:hypothetical protein
MRLSIKLLGFQITLEIEPLRIRPQGSGLGGFFVPEFSTRPYFVTK